MKLPLTPEQQAWKDKYYPEKPKPATPKKTAVELRDFTPDEALMVEALRPVTYPVASWDKRFMRGLTRISERGAVQLARIFVKYRRQINHPDKQRLLAIAEVTKLEGDQ